MQLGRLTDLIRLQQVSWPAIDDSGLPVLPAYVCTPITVTIVTSSMQMQEMGLQNAVVCPSPTQIFKRVELRVVRRVCAVAEHWRQYETSTVHEGTIGSFGITAREEMPVYQHHAWQPEEQLTAQDSVGREGTSGRWKHEASWTFPTTLRCPPSFKSANLTMSVRATLIYYHNCMKV